MSRALQERCIVHVDLDCFYVQVERQLNPELHHVPCAVVQYNKFQGGGIIALSYEAKARGVKRSMRGDQARLVCPDIRLVTVPTANEKADLTRYRSAGSRVFEICSKHSDLCERTSIDEAYLDITERARELLSNMEAYKQRRRLSNVVEGIESKLAESTDFEKEIFWNDSLKSANIENQDSLLAAGSVIVSEIREAVKKETGYTLSAGISHNKMLSKLVSGKNKPNKQTVLPSSKVEMLLNQLHLRDLNGFGGKLGENLINKYNIEYVGDLRKFSHVELVKMAIGSETVKVNSATWMFHACRGICTETVKSRIAAKSISCGKTFRGPNRLRNMKDVNEYIDKLSVELAERLQNAKQKHRQIAKLLSVSYHTGSKTVKRKGQEINLTGSTSKSRSCRCPTTASAVNISSAVMLLLEKELDSESLRLGVTCLYIGASKLEKIRGEGTTIDKLLKKGGSVSSSSSGSGFDLQRSKAVLKRNTSKETTIDKMLTRPLPTKGTNPKPIAQSSNVALRARESSKTTQKVKESKATIRDLLFGSKSSSAKPKSNPVHQLTWNQVDQSVFRELPLELQEELRSSIHFETLDRKQQHSRKKFKWSQSKK